VTTRRVSPILARYLVLATANVAARALAFAAMVAVVRAYGAADFGAIGFATSVVAYAAMFGACGLDVLSVRAVAGRAAPMARLTSTVVLLRLALGAAAYLALIVLAVTAPALRAVAGLVAVYGLSLLVSPLSLTWVAEGLQTVGVLALADLGTQALSLLVLLAGLEAGAGLWAVPAAQVAAELTVAAGVFLWARRAVGRPGRPLPAGQWRAMVVQAAPIGGAKVLRAAALGSDLVVLGCYVGMADVGYYTGALKLYLLGIALTCLYFVVLFPRLVRGAANSTAALWVEVRSSLRLTLAVGMPAVGLAAVLARPVLEWLYGTAFGVATESLQLLLAALLVQQLIGHYRNVLLAQGRQTADLRAVAWGSAAHVAFKVALVPALGISGAALGTLLGEVALLALVWRAAHDGAQAGRRPRPALEEVRVEMALADGAECRI
jgi:O-antigen/teichoic acid export membrane protein